MIFEIEIYAGSKRCLKRAINKADEYLELFYDFNLVQIVDKPTRGDNILDLVFLSEFNSLVNVEVGSPLANSDHAIVCCQLSCMFDCNAVVNENCYCWSKANWGKMRKLLGCIDWWDIFSEGDLSDINTLWSKFKAEVGEVLSKTVPIVSSRSLDKRKSLSKRTYQAIKQKRKAYRHYRSTGSDIDKLAYS